MRTRDDISHAALHLPRCPTPTLTSENCALRSLQCITMKSQYMTLNYPLSSTSQNAQPQHWHLKEVISLILGMVSMRIGKHRRMANPIWYDNHILITMFDMITILCNTFTTHLNHHYKHAIYMLNVPTINETLWFKKTKKVQIGWNSGHRPSDWLFRSPTHSQGRWLTQRHKEMVHHTLIHPTLIHPTLIHPTLKPEPRRTKDAPCARTELEAYRRFSFVFVFVCVFIFGQ